MPPHTFRKPANPISVKNNIIQVIISGLQTHRQSAPQSNCLHLMDSGARTTTRGLNLRPLKGPCRREESEPGLVGLIEFYCCVRDNRVAPSTARLLARGPRVLVGWPLPLGFGLDPGACYWNGVGGVVFNSSSSPHCSHTPGRRGGGLPQERVHLFGK